jgi:hypothetical protein
MLASCVLNVFEIQNVIHLITTTILTQSLPSKLLVAFLIYTKTTTYPSISFFTFNLPYNLRLGILINPH